jgi:hypothetical protein
MGRQSSIPITNQQSSLLISTNPKELFTLIALFMDTESQLALAHICKKVYTYHKEQFKEEIVAFLCLNFEDQYRKVFKCWLNETG